MWAQYGAIHQRSDPGEGEASRTIGVDIGGTKVLAGVVDAAGTIVSVVRAQTPQCSMSPDVVEQTFVVRTVRELVAEHRVAAVGVGAAGFVDAFGSTVMFSLGARRQRRSITGELVAEVSPLTRLNPRAAPARRAGRGSRASLSTG